MSRWAERLGAWFARNSRITWALLMREVSTRYGRDNIGFLWVMAEPTLFAVGVSYMWSQVRPPYENGIQLIPFIITGYFPIILIRQVVNYATGGVRNNAPLLYHRMVTPLHIILSRCWIEFIGVTVGGIAVVSAFVFLGLMPAPVSVLGLADFAYGWVVLGLLSTGLALVMAAIAEVIEFTERIVHIFTYLSLPFSGGFIMAASMPPRLFKFAWSMPFLHPIELMRRGYFGGSTTTMFDMNIVYAWIAALFFAGLLLMQFVRSRINVE
jgi:capsular polysaccharide transport system permease protein